MTTASRRKTNLMQVNVRVRHTLKQAWDKLMAMASQKKTHLMQVMATTGQRKTNLI